MRIPLIVLVCAFGLASCGSLQMGFPLASPTPRHSPGSTAFRCGGPNSVITVTHGTESETADMLLTNLSQTGGQPIDVLVGSRSSPEVIAEDLIAECAQAGLKCGFQGYQAVKICGRLAADWNFSVQQSQPFTLQFTHTDSPGD